MQSCSECASKHELQLHSLCAEVGYYHCENFFGVWSALTDCRDCCVFLQHDEQRHAFWQENARGRGAYMDVGMGMPIPCAYIDTRTAGLAAVHLSE